MSIRDLPALNACLNGASAVLLAFGFAAVKSGRIRTHRLLMGGALLASSAFLVSYLTYHAYAGHVVYHGPARPFYLCLLLTHTVLAAVNLPLILRTVYLAWQERFEEHRRLARWVLPSWMYVSVTGVVVYWMLYRL